MLLPQFSFRKLIFFPPRFSEKEALVIAEQSNLTPWRHGEKQIGWKRLVAESSASTPRVLILHGNAGAAVYCSFLVDILQLAAAPDPVDSYILTYPGYGFREGEPSQVSIVKAATEALDALAASSKSPIIVVGQSIGTGVASQLAAARPDAIAGLLLITPFTSLVDVGQSHYPWAPVRLFWKGRPDRFESKLALKKYHGPISFLVAGKDRVVPTKFGRQLYESYYGPKHLFIATDGDHNNLTETLPLAEWKKAWLFCSQPHSKSKK
ncbi:MAG: alpha/beta hydrolase [Chthoniobacterales bacterium]